MNAKEVRMRSLEAVAAGGIREVGRLIRDADEIAKWVNNAEEDKPEAPQRGRPKGADKE